MITQYLCHTVPSHTASEHNTSVDGQFRTTSYDHLIIADESGSMNPNRAMAFPKDLVAELIRIETGAPSEANLPMLWHRAEDGDHELGSLPATYHRH
jgi:hypothetical protein